MSRHKAQDRGCRSMAEPVVDAEVWGTVQSRGKDAIVAMSEWGVSPRMFGGGLLITLSDLGLVPKVGL
jgi:hypothetical protein